MTVNFRRNLFWTLIVLALLEHFASPAAFACSIDTPPIEDPSVGALCTESLTTTYQAMGVTYRIRIEQPVAAGFYPISIHLVGAFHDYEATYALKIVQTMAEQGIVAATVQYENSRNYIDCPGLLSKAENIFDSKRPYSAISRIIAATAKAAQWKGIAVSGHSQGSLVSYLGWNFNSNVRAAWGMGTGDVRYMPPSSLPCVLAAAMSIPNVRTVNGQADLAFGAGRTPEEILDSNRDNLQRLTNYCQTCNSQMSAFDQIDSKGWYVVSNSETTLQNGATHTYMLGEWGLGIEPNWNQTTAAWGRRASVAWLYSKLSP